MGNDREMEVFSGHNLIVKPFQVGDHLDDGQLRITSPTEMEDLSVAPAVETRFAFGVPIPSEILVLWRDSVILQKFTEVKNPSAL
jgi:hypothetical protein